MSGSHYAPEPPRRNPGYDETTQYDLRTEPQREDAEYARLDRRIDELQALIVRLVDVVQVLRLRVEGDA